MNIPTITSTQNGKLVTVDVGELTLVFSYKTPVAFRHPRTGLVVCENAWNATTGRHLNAIDGGATDRRLPRLTFLELLELVCDGDTATAKYRMDSA